MFYLRSLFINKVRKKLRAFRSPLTGTFACQVQSIAEISKLTVKTRYISQQCCG